MNPFRKLLLAAAVAAASVAAARAQDAPAPIAGTRSELVNRWDLNRDGTIDEAEAEIARAKMRRERAAIEERAKSPLAFPSDDEQADDDVDADDPRMDESKLDPLGRAFLGANGAAKSGASAERPARDEESRDKEPVDDGRVRRRDLNAGRPKGDPSMGTPSSTGRSGAGFDPRKARSPVPGRAGTGGFITGGIITGGARAGAPAIRPGYGVSGPKVDLNAGRLPTGPPPVRGLGPMGGSAPFRPMDRSGMIPGRASEPALPMITPPARPTITAEEIGSP